MYQEEQKGLGLIIILLVLIVITTLFYFGYTEKIFHQYISIPSSQPKNQEEPPNKREPVNIVNISDLQKITK